MFDSLSIHGIHSHMRCSVPLSQRDILLSLKKSAEVGLGSWFAAVNYSSTYSIIQGSFGDSVITSRL